jgi:hypothetical protein
LVVVLLKEIEKNQFEIFLKKICHHYGNDKNMKIIEIIQMKNVHILQNALVTFIPENHFLKIFI